MGRWLLLPWLFTSAACSNAAGSRNDPPDASSAPDDSGGGGFSETVPVDAAPIDEDADLGLACTDAAPGFVTDVAPILIGCSGGELCHGFPSAPYLYRQLVGAPASDGCGAGALVTPRSLRKSYLLHKVTGIAMCANTRRMALLPKETQTIADWICSGAPND